MLCGARTIGTINLSGSTGPALGGHEEPGLSQVSPVSSDGSSFGIGSDNVGLVSRTSGRVSGPFYRDGPTPEVGVGMKGENISPEIIGNVLEAVLSMRAPLITVHVSPDGDAMGSAIGLAIYLKQHGATPTIYVNPKFKIPEIFARLIEEEGIDIVHSIGTQHDGLISLDTSGPVRLEPAVAELLKSGTGIRVVDIDHHLGQEFLAEREYTLATEERASSTSELLAQILGPNMTSNMALALMAGTISDTKNLKSGVRPRTLQTMGELQRQVSQSRDEIYAATLDLTEADKEMVAASLASAVTSTFELRGRTHSILSVVVRKDQLTPEHRNWREALKDLFIFDRGADFGLLVYWDPSHKTHRASLFTSLGSIDLRPVAQEMKKEWGEKAIAGGHPERVVSYFALENYPDDAQAVAHIIDLILQHSLGTPSAAPATPAPTPTPQTPAPQAPPATPVAPAGGGSLRGTGRGPVQFMMPLAAAAPVFNPMTMATGGLSMMPAMFGGAMGMRPLVF